MHAVISYVWCVAASEGAAHHAGVNTPKSTQPLANQACEPLTKTQPCQENPTQFFFSIFLFFGGVAVSHSIFFYNIFTPQHTMLTQTAHHVQIYNKLKHQQIFLTDCAPDHSRMRACQQGTN